MSESIPLLSNPPTQSEKFQSQPPSSSCWTRKKLIIFGCLFCCVLDILIGVILFWPSEPGVDLESLDLSENSRFIIANSTFLVPINVTLSVENDNRISVGLKNTSVNAFYYSETLAQNQLLGSTFKSESIDFEAKATTLFWLVVVLRYDSFRSPIVLSEMTAQCRMKGKITIDFDVKVELSVMFLKDKYVEIELAVDLDCSVG